MLNNHLKTIMPGLSAKVFRTYNATETLQNELPLPDDVMGMDDAEKVKAYNDANRTVAILCNHQRSVSIAAEAGLTTVKEKLEQLKNQRTELVKIAGLVKKGKTDKVPLKKASDAVETAKTMGDDANKQRNAATTEEQRIAAAKAIESARLALRDARKSTQMTSHLWEKVPTEEMVAKRLEMWTKKIDKSEIEVKGKDDNKEVSLGTSKINYMDPRVTVAWCKRVELPIAAVFPTSLRNKFAWACSVPPEWRFDPPGANGGGGAAAAAAAH